MMNLLGDVSLVSIGLACVIALALFVVPIYFDRGALTVIVWPAFGMAQIVIGHAILDEFLGDTFWPIYALSAASVIAGYYLAHSRFTRPRHAIPYPCKERVAACRTLVAFAGIVTFLVGYHFVVGGVPLLSSNVEIERFNFASSGLFGVPGRMYLFGLPFLVTYASYVASRDPEPRMLRLRNLLWGEYAVAMILSGFKGSLVIVIVQWLLVRSLLGNPVLVREVVRPRYLALAAGALAFGAIMATQYESLELPGGSGGATSYLAERVTVVAAAPGALAVRQLDKRTNGYYLVDEVAYFMKKYFHIDIVDHEVFPLDKVVSSQLLGTPLEEDEFVVSVTVGGFAAFVVDFGVWISLVLMFFLGIGYGYLMSRAQRVQSAFWFAALGLVLQAMYTVVINGGLAYSIVNTLTMLLLLGAIQWVCTRTIRLDTDHEDRTRLGEPV